MTQWCVPFLRQQAGKLASTGADAKNTDAYGRLKIVSNKMASSRRTIRTV
jgi:hypothetical protein